MNTKRVNLRLPEELVAQADIVDRVAHRNRTEIIIEVLRQYLEETEFDKNFGEPVVELYLDKAANQVLKMWTVLARPCLVFFGLDI